MAAERSEEEEDGVVELNQCRLEEMTVKIIDS